MRFSDFKKKIQNYPFFRSTLLSNIENPPDTLRVQVSHWSKKGLLIPLKRGMYTLNDYDRRQPFSLFFLANQLYSPSYISLESALSHYGFIPEGVFGITSVSTKKTQRFTNLMGNFTYSHIRPYLYRDFIEITDEYDTAYYIASPERALVDFFYFRSINQQSLDLDYFDDSIRLQNLENIDIDKVIDIARSFKSQQLMDIVLLFHDYLQES